MSTEQLTQAKASFRPQSNSSVSFDMTQVNPHVQARSTSPLRAYQFLLLARGMSRHLPGHPSHTASGIYKTSANSTLFCVCFSHQLILPLRKTSEEFPRASDPNFIPPLSSCYSYQLILCHCDRGKSQREHPFRVWQ